MTKNNRWVKLFSILFVQLFFLQLEAASQISAIKSEVEIFDKQLLKTTSVRIVQSGIKNNFSVLLVHGLGDNGVKDWRGVISELAQSYHVIAIDLPGFGQSELNSEFYSPHQYAKLLHKVKQKYAKSKKIVVIGHSLGGAISLKYASLYPQELSRLVLVSVAGVLQRSVYMRFLASFNDNSKDNGFLSKIKKGALNIVNTVSSSTIEMTDKLPHFEKFIVNNALSKNYLFKNQQTLKSSIALIETDYSLILPQIKMPTHIIWGTEDPVSSLRVAKVFAFHIPKASFDMIKSAKHVPMFTHLKQFNQLVNKVLAGNATYYKPKTTSLGNSEIGNIHCDGESNLYFTGIFNEVLLENCNNIKLENVYAQRIIMRNSSMTFDNLSVNNNEVSLELNDSKMTGNNAIFKGEIPLMLNESWIDIAGGYLIGKNNAVQTDGESKVYFSVSRAQTSQSIYSLHGEYDDEFERL
ncbi:alpha/beta fold hydrolase [Aliikangiella sp. IMCC44359]|uniref:alpha/beta fold hydrolase n=1 Tax=Aliikangiella sp. IMCC44359 TaxID=3459125 RepID=UPI00403AA6CF